MRTTLSVLAFLVFNSVIFCQPCLALPITIDTVPVNNAGNSPDLETGFGGVSYAYRIGTTEVTVGQYTGFLNAVAADDTWGLYHPNMTSGPNAPVTPVIGGIARNGSAGNYSYSVIGSPNMPITYVNWGDAARFVNWLHNGQPTGPQDAGSTEDGAYTLHGANFSAALNAVTRNPGATWFLPSENEWYKAAYHRNDGPTSNYWDYPTASDTAPFAESPPGGANAANYDWVIPANGWDLGMTNVKSYLDSPSPYGTFDQAGNLMEWTEGIESQESSGVFMRGMRGGAWPTTTDSLRATAGNFVVNADGSGTDLGFRVATVPEPTTLSLATLSLLALVGLWSRRRFDRTPTRMSPLDHKVFRNAAQ